MSLGLLLHWVPVWFMNLNSWCDTTLHQHHHLHHILHLVHARVGCSLALGMLVGAVLSSAGHPKLAFDVGVEINALITVGASREELAAVLGVDEGAVFIAVHAVGEVFTADLLLLGLT